MQEGISGPAGWSQGGSAECGLRNSECRSCSLMHLDRAQDLVGKALGVLVLAGDGKDKHLIVVDDEVAMETGEVLEIDGTCREVSGLQIPKLEGKDGGYSAEFGIDAVFGAECGGIDGNFALGVTDDRNAHMALSVFDRNPECIDPFDLGVVVEPPGAGVFLRVAGEL